MTENVPAAAARPKPPVVDRASTSESMDSGMGGDGEETSSKVNPLLDGFNRLALTRQVGLLVGLAAAIAMGLGVVLWSMDKSYKPLLNSNDTYNAKEVITLLQAEGIEFDIDPVSGLILVPESELHQARLAIAGAGFSNDQTVGYELLDESQPLGTSQFMENARYRRGLEGELARTIASINQVRSARVHLAIPKRSVFVRDSREPSASVFLDLYPGALLEKQEVKAITNLVATSVEELSPDKVTIVDQRGRLLSDKEEDPEANLTDKQFQYTRRVEDAMTSRIRAILEPVLGNDKFEAQVSADVDFTRVEQTDELYNPDLIALRSEQVLSEQKVGENNGGIPGALTNQPPGNATAPEQTNPDGTPATPPSSKRDEATRNYEVDRTLSYTQHQLGRLRRITVAVVVDDMKTLADDGTVNKQAWSQEELDRLRILVQDAVGFDAARGDSVNVINSPFMAEQEVIEEIPFWKTPGFLDLLRQVLAGLFVLILIFAVFRPALKNLMKKPEEDEDAAESIDTLSIDDDFITDDKVTLSGADEFLLPGASESFERQLDALRGLIAEDPGKVAMVLRSWIMSDD
ncbi:flagellar basal-body MS-ring/collar protein FliF [Gynuella sunshinyii]|uniref:Flagellar M-ring protein n=1 Tax=Gynuella sunshinyii YC6258 TaxID=1445510 RepID=A0A0C5VSM9_9GAMM|nr:flagellar basal-body MS-ring/collar protein FliF [Gynuella sunshinyii]AJQ96338.1 flagellar biosynthesis/type III secretory pathway lipoprotein [Gynuella sunshinyii YC6258]